MWVILVLVRVGDYICDELSNRRTCGEAMSPETGGPDESFQSGIRSDHEQAIVGERADSRPAARDVDVRETGKLIANLGA